MFWYQILRNVVKPFVKKKMDYEGDIVDLGNSTSMIVCNHVTDVDIVLLGMCFPQHMCTIASEHIFRWGIPSSLLKHFFNIIPRFKGKVEVNTALEALRFMRSGVNVALFPEGSRTFDGKTKKIIPSTGKLAKMGNVDLVTYRLEGAYFNSPRWSKKFRKGKVRGRLVGRYTAEELKGMTFEEVNEIIARDLHEDAYARQRENPTPYAGENLAICIETALYVCPICKQIGSITSEVDDFSCSCGLKARYNEYGFIEGEGVPYDNVTDWNEWQTAYMTEYINGLGEDEVICSDVDQDIYSVEPCVKTTLIGKGTLTVSKSTLTCGEYTFPIKNIVNMSICSKLILTFSTTDGKDYEINSNIVRSALKYQTIIAILKAGSK